MPGSYTRIVIRRPGGKVDVIGRPGHIDPNVVARNFAQAGSGEVLTVWHEAHQQTGGWQGGRHVPPPGSRMVVGRFNMAP